MKKTLIIGPTYIEIFSKVKALPKGNEDIDILSTEQSVSGSGYHCAKLFNDFDLEYKIISPLGEGVYGEAVSNQVRNENIPMMVVDGMMNGCRYTLTDTNGEQSQFIMPGAEYEFDDSFLDDMYLYTDDINCICLFGDMLCGQLSSIQNVLDTLSELDKPLIFVPNGRSNDFIEGVLENINSYHPTLIVSDTEAYYLANEYSGELRDVAKHLGEMTHGIVMIIKQGEGTFVYDQDECFLAPNEKKIDFDKEVALYLCAKQCGVDLKNAVMFASTYASNDDIDDAKDRLKQLIMVK